MRHRRWIAVARIDVFSFSVFAMSVA